MWCKIIAFWLEIFAFLLIKNNNVSIKKKLRNLKNEIELE